MDSCFVCTVDRLWADFSNLKSVFSESDIKPSGFPNDWSWKAVTLDALANINRPW